MEYSYEEFLEDLSMGREIHLIIQMTNSISVVDQVISYFGNSMI